MKVALLNLLVFFSISLSHAQKRVALVVGNANYLNQSDLKNPVNDARLMKATFEKLGFKVHHYTNATSLELLEAVRKFHAALTPGSIAAVFFSGHGSQVDDRNYILPTDLKAHFKYELKKSSPSLKDILSVMEAAKTSLNLIFLDCCRDVPNLMTKERNGHQGLAPFRTESDNTLVSYATKHGMVAFDNPGGSNSLYTATLAEEIIQSDIVIEEVLRRVAKTVFQKSEKRQRPWSYGNLLEPVYLAGKTDAPPPADQPLSPSTSIQIDPPSSQAPYNAVIEFARRNIRQARSIEPSQIYLGTFGNMRAAVSLQWLDEMDAVRGSIFPITTESKGIHQQWQFIGTNFVQGEINIHIYDGEKLIANGSLSKQRQGDDLLWVGRTNRGEDIQISRTLQRKPAAEIRSTYRGKIGTSEILMTLDWGKDRRVNGFYQSLTSGKSYQLKGDNTADGFIYLDEFSDDNISARILLEKKTRDGNLVWTGKIFNPDGRINPVTIYRE